ncbi:MYC associated zinc finger protein [Homo sapiens]|uniref:MYC associated zinc finger protein n=1 Tax=Homo sapiens TaxID=9606 RepID=H3BTS8_HUMAN|nr:MYC associated zinc finger protein [Homo sapiens]KAI4054372.1 MYC associated zinc finger protein [Homo sapiens]
MFPVFPCTLLAPPFPVLGLDSRGVGGLMNSFPPPQGHAQNPLQVGAELQSRFFASQGCAQSPFQAAPAPPPTPQAPAAEPLQVDLLPVLAAAQDGSGGSGSSGSSSSPSHSCGLPLGGGGGACELSATSLPTLVSSKLVAGERGEWSRVPWYKLLSPLFSHQLLFPYQPRSLQKERRKKCFLRGIR